MGGGGGGNQNGVKMQEVFLYTITHEHVTEEQAPTVGI
jgi:hypothetical protein